MTWKVCEELRLLRPAGKPPSLIERTGKADFGNKRNNQGGHSGAEVFRQSPGVSYLGGDKPSSPGSVRSGVVEVGRFFAAGLVELFWRRPRAVAAKKLVGLKIFLLSGFCAEARHLAGL